MSFKNLVPSRSLPVVQLGFFVSFTGSLPPGVVTLGVLQAQLAGGLTSGMYFSLGALVVEVTFVRLLLSGMALLSRKKNWFKIIELGSLAVVSVLAIGAGWAVFHPTSSGASTAVFWPAGLSPFLAGMLLRLLTPTFILFWLAWNKTLFSQIPLLPRTGQYWAYLAGIAAGTFSAHLLIIGLSSIAQGVLKHIQIISNWLVFIALTAISVGQIWKLKKAGFKVIYKSTDQEPADAPL